MHRGRYWDDRLQCWTDKPSPAIERLMYSEATMPGDVGTLDTIGMAEGESIWNRMAAIIRARSLDVRILMDAHDRRNFGFVDIPTFRRSLCYAFGNQWIDLAMTSAELKEICAPYLTRKPNAAGEPEAFVLWQKFTVRALSPPAPHRRHTRDATGRRAPWVRERECCPPPPPPCVLSTRVLTLTRPRVALHCVCNAAAAPPPHLMLADRLAGACRPQEAD